MAIFQVQGSAPDPQASAARVNPVDWYGAVERGVDLAVNLQRADDAHDQAVQTLQHNEVMSPIIKTRGEAEIALVQAQTTRAVQDNQLLKARRPYELLKIGVDMDTLAAQVEGGKVLTAKRQAEVEAADAQYEYDDILIRRQYADAEHKLRLALLTGDNDKIFAAMAGVETLGNAFQSEKGKDFFASESEALMGETVDVVEFGNRVTVPILAAYAHWKNGNNPDVPVSAEGQAMVRAAQAAYGSWWRQGMASETRARRAAQQLNEAKQNFGLTNNELQQSIETDQLKQKQQSLKIQQKNLDAAEANQDNILKAQALMVQSALESQQYMSGVNAALANGDAYGAGLAVGKALYINQQHGYELQDTLLARQKAAREGTRAPAVLGGRLVTQRAYGKNEYVNTLDNTHREVQGRIATLETILSSEESIKATGIPVEVLTQELMNLTNFDTSPKGLMKFFDSVGSWGAQAIMGPLEAGLELLGMPQGDPVEERVKRQLAALDGINKVTKDDRVLALFTKSGVNQLADDLEFNQTQAMILKNRVKESAPGLTGVNVPAGQGPSFTPRSAPTQ